MARLPQPGGDSGNWGDILNDYLSTSLKADGSLKDDTVGTSQLKDNSVTAAQLAPSSVTSASMSSNAVTKADVGLGSVDNTADADKPVSTAQQAALDLKANISALATKLNTADLDAQTAAKISDGGSAIAGALGASYERLHNPLMIGALGTSITEGGSAGGSPNRWTDVLPTTLTAIAPELGTVAVVNAGVSGNNSAQMLARLAALLTANPTMGCLFIEVSVNDFKITGGLNADESMENIVRMIALARFRGVEPIVIGSAPFDAAAWVATLAPVQQTLVNAAIKAMCASQNVRFIDMAQKLAGVTTGMWTDGLHPTAAGQKAWAAAAAAAILGLLADREVYDSFSRANDAASLGSTTSGTKWIPAVGTWGVTSGQAYAISAGTANIALTYVGSANQRVSVKVGAAGAAVVLRSEVDSDPCYIYNTNGPALYKKVTGVFTTLATTNVGATPTFVVSDTVAVEIVGTAFNIYKNGVLVQTAADAAITAGDYTGIYGGGTARWDNFSARPA